MSESWRFNNIHRLVIASLCVSAALGVSRSYTSLRKHRQLNSFFQDSDGNGIRALFNVQGGTDEKSLDWNQFRVQDFNWSKIDWTPNTWNNFLQSLKSDNTTGTIASEFCPVLEAAVGIGQSFGLAANCSCDGKVGDRLSIDCDFDKCLGTSFFCGLVGLDFTFANDTGLVKTSVCVDTALDQYEEICFAYELLAPDIMNNIFNLEQRCEASYGGNPCTCSISDFCLAIDCSAYLPGAQMDTCQHLSFDQAADATSLIPHFSIFNDTFNDTFQFGNINWTNLDWAHLDWNNFGFEKVNWTGADWGSTFWGSLFPPKIPLAEVCPILTGRVLRMNEDVFGGGCSCAKEQERGYNVNCFFQHECARVKDGGAVALSHAGGSGTATVCGNVTLDFGFHSVGSINGSLCVDLDQDIHPVTCIDYAIPIADQATVPTCGATYGGQSCNCTIDKNLCVKVNCSSYDPTAVMDTCQVLSVAGLKDVGKLIPDFGIPDTPSPSPSGPPKAGEASPVNVIASNNKVGINSSSAARTTLATGLIVTFVTLGLCLQSMVA